MSHVRDIHDTFYIVAHITQCFFQHVLHDVATQIADMRVMIYRRSAGIHGNLSILMRNHRIDISCQCIVKFELILHFGILRFFLFLLFL